MNLAVPSSRVISVPTTPVDNKVVIISQEAKAARAAVPSLSSAIPTPTPITNKSAMLSINAAPALIRKNPIVYAAPLAT